MTGPEHYREAEICLLQADGKHGQLWAAIAQAHATLAVAAATADAYAADRGYNSWLEVLT